MAKNKNSGKVKFKFRIPTLAEIKNYLKNIIHLMRTSSRFRHGTMATVMTAVFFVFIVILNLIVMRMTEKYSFMTIDMTDTGLYTLSETTEELLKGIDERVEIDILATEAQCNKSSALVQDTYGQIPIAHELIKRYTQLNDNIKINYVDISTMPAYVLQFPEYTDQLDYYSIVIKSAKRTRVTSFYEMLPALDSSYTQYDSTTMTDAVAQSYTETYMTSLIKTVTMEKTPVISFISGINVDGNSADLMSILQVNGYDVQVTDIRKDDIPENADVVLIAAPTTDLNQAQMQKLDDYLSGGSHTLIVFSSSLMPDLPNLNSLLAEYGISITQDIVYEGDTSQTISSQSSAFTPQMPETNYTSDLLERLKYPAVSNAVALDILFEQKGGINVSPILTSTDSGYVCSSSTVFDKSKYTSDDQDKRVVMAAATAYRDSMDGSSLRTDVIVIPDSVYEMDFLGSDAYGNLSLMLNIFNQRSGIDGETVDINAKSLYAVDFSVDIQTLSMLSTIFGYLLPLVALLCGLIVYIRRKRL